MKVRYDDYEKQTVEDCYFKVACILMVKETKQQFCEDDEIRMTKPDLTVKVIRMTKPDLTVKVNRMTKH